MSTEAIDWVIPLVDALIIKLDELSLELTTAYWNYDASSLMIEMTDRIAHEQITWTFSRVDVNRWGAATSPRASEYLLDLMIRDAVELTPSVGCAGDWECYSRSVDSFYYDWSDLDGESESASFSYSF